MKAQYLIQVTSNNDDMVGASGWFTVSGAMTKKAALELLKDFQDAETYAQRTRGLRLIKSSDYTLEVQQRNREAMAKNHAYKREIALSLLG
jgi:hypothetical protein